MRGNQERPMIASSNHSDVLILGTGIAGLFTAVKFATQNLPSPHSRKLQITLICKSDPEEGATRYAQGGIATVWSKQDSFEEHKRDTLSAGAGLCHEDVVDLCVQDGPARVRELIDLGVEFTKVTTPEGIPPSDPAEVFDLHREGGHGRRRILHADDLTGWAIEKALLEQVARHPNITLLPHHTAVDLITSGGIRRKREPGLCLGAYVLNESTGEVMTFDATVTVLATGGAGKAYLYTSNPDTATGDGIAMAHRAGARVANLEFMQFHPTCLYHTTERTFLISEALRGEGAILKTRSGEEFMGRHHPLASLAPRDIVARAIDVEMKRTGDKHVHLDCRHLPPDKLKRKFPNIYKTILDHGIDLTSQPIPVVPAAHYMCGGILTDKNGQTSIDGLYALGESACTGLHGANRLASNSLLEAVVFSHRAVEHARAYICLAVQNDSGSTAPKLDATPVLPDWNVGHVVELEEQLDVAANWLEIRRLMWDYVGIVRSNRRLERARRRIELLRSEVNADYRDFLLTRDLVELRNLLCVADLIVECALARKESRGLHYTVDYPHKDQAHFTHDTIL
jgi:L-aspartate oxidase